MRLSKLLHLLPEDQLIILKMNQIIMVRNPVDEIKQESNYILILCNIDVIIFYHIRRDNKDMNIVLNLNHNLLILCYLFSNILMYFLTCSPSIKLYQLIITMNLYIFIQLIIFHLFIKIISFHSISSYIICFSIIPFISGWNNVKNHFFIQI